MIGYSIVVFIVYIGLLIYIIPRAGLDFDLNEVRFRLLPYRFKMIAIVWIIMSIILAIVFSQSVEKWEEYLISAVNLSLFVLIFSRQREEDEFSTQVRFKSFTFAFISFIGMVGAFGVITIYDNESTILNNFFLHIWVGVSMLISLIHFYITIYKLKKDNS